jgi:DNA-binding NarL/FixJ family response regulator
MLAPTGDVTRSSEQIAIVIAGEYPIFRQGLRRLLEAEPEFVIAGETGETAVALALVRECRPDILLLGLVPSLTPAAVMMQQVSALQTSTKTIILTDRLDSPDILSVLQHGARGIVPKDSEPRRLFDCIRSVMAGHIWFDREAAADAVPELRRMDAARRRAKAFGLTRRELEILRAVVAGCTNKQIAERSALSENTVKSHLTHIFNKSGASNRVELALFAAHHRLLDGI